jgi:hypothetical protein
VTEHPIDRTKSIQELTGDFWPDPGIESYVIRTSHAVRRKPLDSLSLEDIRMGVMQQVGLTYLVPIAIEAVEQDPFAESMHFEAEITLKLLQIPYEYWKRHPALRDRLERVYEHVEEGRFAMDESWHDSILPDIRKAHAQFRGDLPSNEWLARADIDRERELWKSCDQDEASTMTSTTNKPGA